MATQQHQQTAVCCGCFGGGGGGGKHEEGEKMQNGRRRRSTVFHSAAPGEVQQLEAPSQQQFYFDAEQEELEDDEYPIITTTYVWKPPSRRLSIDQPETLLRSPSEQSVVAASAPPPLRRQSLRTSLRRLHLEEPRVHCAERGYPGQLNPTELDQCMQFYREIIRNRPVARDIVFAYQDFEEKPYGLCRFMRAVKFKAEEMLERLERGADEWTAARERDFFPDLERALGVSPALFLQTYPYFNHGNAKNGCPVSYFKAGKVDVEGILCLSTLQHTPGFFWHIFMHQLPPLFRRAQEKDPNFVRCESINVIDMSGLSRAQVSAEAMESIKILARIGNYFPETLHCMIILNAPGWFAIVWKVIKSFIDPRSAKKIEVYTRPKDGQHRVLELIDAQEVPSDFGGNGPATESLMMQGSKDDKQRYIVRVVDLRKRHARKLTHLVELKECETASVTIYTRSCTGCSVSVLNEVTPICEHVKVSRTTKATTDDSERPTPYSTEICSGVSGPGRILVQLQDLGDHAVDKKLPHGYFLIAATVQS